MVSQWLGQRLRLLFGGALMIVALEAGAQSESPFSPMLTLRMGDKVIELELEQLDALAQAQLDTSTTLQPEVVRWTGPLARELLTLLGVEPGTELPMAVMSWDDYRVDMSTEDFYRWDVLVATRADGKVLDATDLGPTRIIYPRDQHVELQDSRFDHRWVWLLREIAVNP